MSQKLCISFQVTNMLIMEETLKRLGQSFTKKGDALELARPYYNMMITKDNVTCDSMHRHEVDKIKYEYQKELQLREIAQRGEQFEVVENTEEIIITVQ